jgi:hypothetical protein
VIGRDRGGRGEAGSLAAAAAEDVGSGVDGENVEGRIYIKTKAVWFGRAIESMSRSIPDMAILRAWQ